MLLTIIFGWVIGCYLFAFQYRKKLISIFNKSAQEYESEFKDDVFSMPYSVVKVLTVVLIPVFLPFIYARRIYKKIKGEIKK